MCLPYACIYCIRLCESSTSGQVLVPSRSTMYFIHGLLNAPSALQVPSSSGVPIFKLRIIFPSLFPVSHKPQRDKYLVHKGRRKSLMLVTCHVMHNVFIFRDGVYNNFVVLFVCNTYEYFFQNCLQRIQMSLNHLACKGLIITKIKWILHSTSSFWSHNHTVLQNKKNCINIVWSVHFYFSHTDQSCHSRHFLSAVRRL